MADAETLLFFNNQQDLLLFTQQVRMLLLTDTRILLTAITRFQRGWQPDLVRRVFTFPTKTDDKSAEIPSKKIIAQALTCAKELEQIV